MRIKTIRIFCNWENHYSLVETWKKMLNDEKQLIFKNKNFVLKIINEGIPDFYIVINDSFEFFPSIEDLSKTIFFKMEPIFLSSFWHQISSELLFSKIDHSGNKFNNLEWQINKTYSELINSDFSKLKIKNNIISSIISSKNFEIGHKLRRAFVLEAQKFFLWDVYGKDEKFYWKKYFGYIKNKEDALIPYKYSFACENNFLPNYVTEKLIDCIISETLCFYSGAPNVEKIIDPKCYITIDVVNVSKGIQQIQKAIEENEWEKRISFIKKEKKKILNEKSFFPRLLKMIFDD
jgi:hypothetical protein